MSIDLNMMPKLGFGLMRLPEKEGKIDLEHLNRMVDAYMQAGMNYFDTAMFITGGIPRKRSGKPSSGAGRGTGSCWRPNWGLVHEGTGEPERRRLDGRLDSRAAGLRPNPRDLFPACQKENGRPYVPCAALLQAREG